MSNSNNTLWVRVEIRDILGKVIKTFTINHDDPAQRRVLGEQCRNAFEAGQRVSTWPVTTIVKG